MANELRTPEQQFRAGAAAIFKQLRSERGWSYRDFGERVGVAHTSLYAVERLENTPTIDTLGAVAAAFDLTLPALLALIIDAMTCADGDTSLASVLHASSSLTSAQRREVHGFIDYLRFRDRHPDALESGE